MVRSWYILYILIWKYISRYNNVHFFDIPISKSGPTMICFVYFDFKISIYDFPKEVRTRTVLFIFLFEMCFAPKQPAFFRPLNRQKFPNAVFQMFHLKIYFARQRRPLFPHLNFKKTSEPDLFIYFDFKNFNIWTPKTESNL